MLQQWEENEGRIGWKNSADLLERRHSSWIYTVRGFSPATDHLQSKRRRYRDALIRWSSVHAISTMEWLETTPASAAAHARTWSRTRRGRNENHTKVTGLSPKRRQRKIGPQANSSLVAHYCSMLFCVCHEALPRLIWAILRSRPQIFAVKMVLVSRRRCQMKLTL